RLRIRILLFDSSLLRLETCVFRGVGSETNSSHLSKRVLDRYRVAWLTPASRARLVLVSLPSQCRALPSSRRSIASRSLRSDLCKWSGLFVIIAAGSRDSLDVFQLVFELSSVILSHSPVSE